MSIFGGQIIGASCQGKIKMAKTPLVGDPQDAGGTPRGEGVRWTHPPNPSRVGIHKTECQTGVADFFYSSTFNNAEDEYPAEIVGGESDFFLQNLPSFSPCFLSKIISILSYIFLFACALVAAGWKQGFFLQQGDPLTQASF